MRKNVYEAEYNLSQKMEFPYALFNHQIAGSMKYIV